jgi:hypothetical protein
MDANHGNGDLARHQAMFSSFIRAATWMSGFVIVLLALMATFLL